MARPAIAPKASVALAPRKAERLNAITSEQRKASANTLPSLARFSAASSSPASFIHALANSSGEYQAPPTTKLIRAATRIAG